MPNAQTAEHERLAEATGRAEDDLFNANPWYEWGPYLSERAWGTVREDYSESGDAWDSFPHDHARSRAYRWNEDGMAGISDIRHELCLALALWNGNDPILKERMFGLTGPQGNHGEDVKEYWWYLEGLPSHALLKWRYHYPQAEFPYAAAREPRPRTARPRAGAARHRRLRRRPLLVGRRHLRQGLADRGADADRAREPRPGRGDAARAADALVPQHVVVRTPAHSGRGSSVTARRSSWPTTGSPATGSTAPPGPTARRRRRCSARTSRTRRASSARGDARRTRRTGSTTTSSRARPPSTRTASARRRALRYVVTVAAGGKAELRLRLHRPAARRRRAGDLGRRGVRRRSLAAREADADEFYAALAPAGTRRGAHARSCARPAPGSSGASRCTRTTSAAGSTATRASRRRPRRIATAATAAGGTSTRSTCSRCRTRGSTRGSRPGTSASTASPGRTSIRRSRSTS